MKKNLLLFALSALALGATAQTAGPQLTNSGLTKAQKAAGALKMITKPGVLNADVPASPVFNTFKAHKAVRQADATLNVSYLLPYPSYKFGIITADASSFMYGYEMSRLYTPALVDQTFMSYGYADPDSVPTTFQWEFRGDTLTTRDLKYQSIGGYLAPTLKVTQNGVSSTYQWASTNTQGKTTVNAWFAGTDSITQLDMYDANAAGPYGGFQGGVSFSTKKQFNNTGHNAVGFAVQYPAVGDSVYVYSNHLIVATDNTVNLKNEIGTANPITLTLSTVNEDGSLTTFKTATCDSTSMLANVANGWYCLKFNFEDSDPLLGTVAAPFTLPNEPIVAQYTGFDKLNSSVMATFYSADGLPGSGYVILDDGSLSTVGYSNEPDMPQIHFMAGWDGVIPVLKSAMDEGVVVDVPTAGGYGVTTVQDGKSYNDYDVYTVTPLDPDWSPLVIEDQPDWITEVSHQDVNENYQGQEYFLNATAFFFKGDALPAGTKGREGNVVISLYGKRLSIPVKQGEVANGISSVKSDVEKDADNRIYNLAGQQVTKAYKGVVISNGKKFIQK